MMIDMVTKQDLEAFKKDLLNEFANDVIASTETDQMAQICPGKRNPSVFHRVHCRP